MKRFYEQVHIEMRDDGYVILLDAHELKTPSKRQLALPNLTLAELIAEEWRAQEDKVDPRSMPSMRLSATAIDRVSDRFDDTLGEFKNYVSSDLLCYRGSGQKALADRHIAEWDPILAWAAARYDVSFAVTDALMPIPQPDETIARLSQAVCSDVFALTSTVHATAVTGSAVLALALYESHIDAQGAFELSCLDNLFQLEVWGEDEGERQKLDNIFLELSALNSYFRALKHI